MQLLKARLNGVGNLLRSEWFDLSPGCNFMHIPDGRLRQVFLQQLATINPLPPFSCAQAFGDLPATLNEHGYPRRLYPGKRTAALAVFAAGPSLIAELGKFDSILDGVDRIEVGRRLDGSRWLNFVEIASACRWREIEADVAQLLIALGRPLPALAQLGVSLTCGLEPSRRIKDNLETELAAWLSRVVAESPPHVLKTLAERVLHEVTRPSRVALAKRLAEDSLPMFIDLDALPSLGETTTTNSSGPRLSLGERIVLVDGDQAELAAQPPGNLAKLLEQLAENGQVLCALGNNSRIPASHPALIRRGVPGLRRATA